MRISKWMRELLDNADTKCSIEKTPITLMKAVELIAKAQLTSDQKTEDEFLAQAAFVILRHLSTSEPEKGGY